jgi:curved DNA-binding protein
MAVKFQDYYQTLGVARTATPEEIKIEFRKLARIHHPDVAKDKLAGDAKFKEINEAYEVLGDPEKRRRYDELGADWQDGPRAEAGDPFAGRRTAQNRAGGGAPGDGGGFEYDGTGFSDFFESFFSGGRGARNPGQGRPEHYGADAPFAGRDVEADLLVTLEEALRGSSRKITLRRPAEESAAGRSDTYQVRIPPGVHEGQRIRLAGQGGPGHGGAGAGDLYLRVRLARHPEFVVQGTDLLSDLDLAPWEAVLGVQVAIPTLDGRTTLRVPAGVAAGLQLRLRGLGLPRETGARGDLFVTVRLCTPQPVSEEERVLWAQLAKISTFNPRTKS